MSATPESPLLPVPGEWPSSFSSDRRSIFPPDEHPTVWSNVLESLTTAFALSHGDGGDMSVYITLQVWSSRVTGINTTDRSSSPPVTREKNSTGLVKESRRPLSARSTGRSLRSTWCARSSGVTLSPRNRESALQGRRMMYECSCTTRYTRSPYPNQARYQGNLTTCPGIIGMNARIGVHTTSRSTTIKGCWRH